MIHGYRVMIDDPIRLQAFQKAITVAVCPGDVVLDLGCAMGNFSILACRAGARRVYAVEISPIIEVARQVVRANGCTDRVRFLPGASTSLEVPERANVVLFEDYPTTLLAPSVARVAADIRERWLAPGGKLIPARARLWLAAVEDPLGHHEIDRFAATRDRVCGIDLSVTRHLAFSTWHSRRLGPAALLAPPTLVREVDLASIGSPTYRVSARLTATRSGALHGLLLWFELELGDAWLGTGPLSPSSSWHQTVFPLERPLVTEVGETIEVELEAGELGDDLVWRWRAAAGDRACEGNSLEGMPMRADVLARSGTAHVPAVQPELDRAILATVDGQRTVGEIAALVADRFPSLEEAQRKVLTVLRRYEP